MEQFIEQFKAGKTRYYFPYMIRQDSRITAQHFLEGLEAATAEYLKMQMDILKLNMESRTIAALMFNDYLMIRSEFLRIQRDFQEAQTE